MIKNLLLVLCVLFCVQNNFSQIKREIMKKAPMIFSEKVVPEGKITGVSDMSALATYVGVDTMTNALSFAETGVTPLYYEPYSGSLTMVHRGWNGHYGSLSSGTIWYNFSGDFGTTWGRVPGPVNALNTTILGRYPNMTVNNHTKGGLAATTGFFGWPELNPSTFGYLGYGDDKPVNAGSYNPFIDYGGDWSSRVMAAADDQSSYFFWTAEYLSVAGMKMFKTNDFATITQIDPPEWNDSVFQSNGNIGIGACAYNGVWYVGDIGPYPEWMVPNPPTGGWLVGYSKSTDQGATWSTFKMADWRNIPSVANYDELFDYKKGDAFISYQGSMGVDKNNHVHILISVTDTTTDKDHGTNSIIDVFETSSGGWNATVVFTGLDTTYSIGPGVGQMGPCATLAFDSSHTIMAVQFANASGNSYNSLYLTYKGLYDTKWAAPVTLSSNANINNTSSHLAPFLRAVGSNQYEAFSAFCYGLAPFSATYDGNTTAVLYASNYTFTVPVLTLTGLIQGFYNGATMVADTVTVECHNATSPHALVASTRGVLNSSGVGTFTMGGAATGTPYYIVVKHRNTVETWSGSTASFSGGGTLSYNFTTSAAQAYGNNMILKSGKYCFYSGDVSQDGQVTFTDLIAVDNDNTNFVAGYTNTDLTGDNQVTFSDLIIVDNNNSNFISKVIPTGPPSAIKVNRPVKIKTIHQQQ